MKKKQKKNTRTTAFEINNQQHMAFGTYTACTAHELQLLPEKKQKNNKTKTKKQKSGKEQRMGNRY